MIKPFTAALLHKHKKPLKILKNLNFEEIKNKQVLVRIYYSGLCGSQVAEINGFRDDSKYLPHLLGHEGYGKVIKVGSKVSKVKINDKVILSWIKGKGYNSKGIKIKFKDKIINAGPVTTFSKYSIISENRCYLAPKNINPQLAVLFGCAIPTGLGMLINELKPKCNKNFILFGAGGIGIVTLIGLKLFKPKSVTVVDINTKKYQFIKKINKNYNFIRYTNNLREILKTNNNEFFDYAIDCSGKVESINTAFKVIKDKGELIFASHPKKNKKITIDPFDLIKGKKLIGSWGGSCRMDKDINKFYLLHKKKKINLSMLKTKMYKINDINKAISDYKKGKIIRAIFKN